MWSGMIRPESGIWTATSLIGKRLLQLCSEDVWVRGQNRQTEGSETNTCSESTEAQPVRLPSSVRLNYQEKLAKGYREMSLPFPETSCKTK